MVRFRHPLDRYEGASFMDLGPVVRPGDAETVNSTGYYGKSFEQVEGASYREILDTGDWDKSLAINVPGQSGQPGSAHYSDLLPLWAEGQYFPLVYTRAAVEKEATDKLTLEPQANVGHPRLGRLQLGIGSSKDRPESFLTFSSAILPKGLQDVCAADSESGDSGKSQSFRPLRPHMQQIAEQGRHGQQCAN